MKLIHLPLLVAISLNFASRAETLDDAEKILSRSNNTEEQIKVAAAKIIQIISDTNQPMETRVMAVEMAGKYRLKDAVDTLIVHLIQVHIRHKGLVRYERQFPCINALAEIRAVAVPKLAEAIKSKDEIVRTRMLAYALMKVMTNREALKHIDKCIADSDEDDVLKRLRIAKDEISGWTDLKTGEPK